MWMVLGGRRFVYASLGGDLDRKAGWNAAAIGFFGSCSRGKTNYAADSEIYSSGGVGAVGCVDSGALGEWGDQGSGPVKIMGAGLSGLAAATVLAKAGVEVHVHDSREDSGKRFDGDFQALENW